MENIGDSTFWRNWLLKYKSYKCLWDPSDKTTSEERSLAWNKLIEMAKTFNKKANGTILRECLQKYAYKYKLEARKVQVAKANGIFYEPTAFYYKIFRTIHGVRNPEIEDWDTFETTEIVEERKNLQAKTPGFDPKSRFWSKVIKRYVSLKCLWDQENKYSDAEKLDAWDELLTMVKPHYALVDVEFLKRRFNAMCASYRREAREMAKARENGHEYKTKLYYFDLLTPIYQNDNLIIEDDGNDADPDSVDEDALSDDEVKFQVLKVDVSQFSEEKQVWINILEKYVSLKCLWDHKKNYSHVVRLKAWLILLKMVKKLHPEANVKFVKKKINAFRTNYRRELNRMKRFDDEGIDYTTHLFYMDVLAPIYWSDYETTKEEEDTEQFTIFEPVMDDVALAEVSWNLKKDKDLLKCTKDVKLWRKFIKKFVNFDCLWDNRYVYKKKEKTKAWLKLLKFVQSYYPAAHTDYIRNRMQIIRSSFEKEHEKILAAKENGIELKSKKFFYELMRPMYELEGDAVIQYSSDESIEPDCPETNSWQVHPKCVALREELESSGNICGPLKTEGPWQVHPKYVALREELESLGYICGPLETEGLSNEQKAWHMFIKRYVSFKCLWDVNRDNYTQAERDVAWHELLGMVKATINPEADLTLIKSRVNAFRTNYVRCLKKARDERAKGLESEVTLWYFNSISPIYQEGFPIILNEDEELQSEPTLNPKYSTYFPEEETLNPRFTTYFPDNEKVESKPKIKAQVEVPKEAEYYILPINILESKSLEQAGVCNDDDDSILEVKHAQESDDEESHVNQNEESITTKESLPQTQTINTRKTRQKRKFVQKKEAQNDVKKQDSKKMPEFHTFETNIASHLDTMECEQYLLAEKLISEVCVYGRLGKLSIESSFKLKTT